jgi:hypothetical protein
MLRTEDSWKPSLKIVDSKDMFRYALISSYHVQYRSDSRPVWSRTSDCQSGNPGSNPGCRIL